jgi:hypothetical protein
MYWITVTMLGMAHYFFRKGSSMQTQPDTGADSGESDTQASDAHETRAGEPDTSASDIDAPDSGATDTDVSETAVNDDSEDRKAASDLHTEPDSTALRQKDPSLDTVTDPEERHRLYTRQIETAYRNRRISEEDLYTAMTLSTQYVEEFDSLKQAVLDTMEETDRIVPVFRMLAIMLEEARAYDQAVDICRQAQAHGIEDGTRTGFEGRIKRLMKKKEEDND